MKKALIVLCVLLIAAVPPVNPDGKDWRHTGLNEFTKQITIQGEILSGAKIAAYDSVVTQMADSVSLSDALPEAVYDIPTYANNSDAKADLGVGKFWKKSTGELFITVP